MSHPIEVKNLVKSFTCSGGLWKALLLKQKEITILDDLSFYVEAGEYLGVVGRNGAGKSTLLRILGGVYTANSGIVSVRGSIASVFEMGAFMNMQQTGREYCKQYLDLLAKPGTDILATVESILDFTELGAFFECPVHTYSSGMQAKLLFALATAQPADVLLIDEMLIVGDIYFQNRAWRRLRDALGGDSCGVIVSHDWVSLLRLCRRAMMIENHKIKMIGPAGPVLNVNQGLNDYDSDTINIMDKEQLLSRTYTAKSGGSFEFQYRAFVNSLPEENILGASFFIERYVVGEGWHEVVFIEKDSEITETGIYEYTFKIPELPLKPGRYQIALELFKPLEPGQQVYSTVYTKMNWLRGNAMDLLVTGEPDGSIIQRRLEWKVAEE